MANKKKLSERFPSTEPRPRIAIRSTRDIVLLCIFIASATLALNKIYARSKDVDEQRTLSTNYTFWRNIVSPLTADEDVDQPPPPSTTQLPINLSRRWSSNGPSFTSTEPPLQSPTTSDNTYPPKSTELPPAPLPPSVLISVHSDQKANFTSNLLRLLHSTTAPQSPIPQPRPQH